ncbi:MAG: ABC transporter ATP-binding protein [Erysipelotrichaceae bacterium]|jgi:oligopeptide transport system ATP-binding protein|nr:ABC transporter ATP-binding protein [Erysipelotrichaceae bacterium]
MSERKIILSAKDIEVKFRVRDNYLNAIRGVSLDLYDGETFAIVGESGSGKSVFTKTFTGMLESNGKITNGSVMYDGKDLTKLVSDKDWEGIRGAKIATIFQDPMTSLNPIRTIGSQITEVIIKHQKVSADEAKKQAVDIMDRVGIIDAEKRFNEYPFQYSGGMRQRIVIAIALSCHPEILICDEPTTALDVTIQAQIIDLIKDLQKELKFTTIYITHDLGVVANVADRVGVMYGGQIIEIGTVEEIFYDPAHPYTWALLSSLPQLGVKGQELSYITGTPPSLYNIIKGDAFAPRNKYALKIDFEEEPPFFKITDTHYAKTWLLDPRAPKVEKPEAIRNLHEKIASMTSKGGAYYVEQK